MIEEESFSGDESGMLSDRHKRILAWCLGLAVGLPCCGLWIYGVINEVLCDLF